MPNEKPPIPTTPEDLARGFVSYFATLYRQVHGKEYRPTPQDLSLAVAMVGNGNGDLHHARDMAALLFSDHPAFTDYRARHGTTLAALNRGRTRLESLRVDIAAHRIAEAARVRGARSPEDLLDFFPEASDRERARAWEVMR